MTDPEQSRFEEPSPDVIVPDDGSVHISPRDPPEGLAAAEVPPPAGADPAPEPAPSFGQVLLERLLRVHGTLQRAAEDFDRSLLNVRGPGRAGPAPERGRAGGTATSFKLAAEELLDRLERDSDRLAENATELRRLF